MTSLLSSYKLGNTLPNPTSCVVCTYSSGGNELPVPFTFDRRTSILDMSFSSGFSKSTNIDSVSKYFRGQTFGTLYTINGIGPNFIEWMEDEGGADPGSVTIYEKPIIVPANVVQVNQSPNSEEALSDESDTPISYEIANGSLSNDYYATYLFQKPLVLRYTVNGTSKWRAFLTQFGEGNE